MNSYQQPQPEKAPRRFFSWVRASGLFRGDDRWIGGVCSGIAQRLGWSATLVRALMIVSSLFFGFGAALYALGWFLMPDVRDGHILAEDLIAGHWDWNCLGCFLFMAVAIVIPGAGWVCIVLAALALWLLAKSGIRQQEGYGFTRRAGRQAPPVNAPYPNMMPPQQPDGQPGGQFGGQPGGQFGGQPGGQFGGQPGPQPGGQFGQQPAAQPGGFGPQSGSQPGGFGPQYAGQPGPWPAGQPGGEPVSGPVDQFAGQPGAQPASQPGPQPGSQSGVWPGSQNAPFGVPDQSGTQPDPSDQGEPGHVEPAQSESDQPGQFDQGAQSEHHEQSDQFDHVEQSDQDMQSGSAAYEAREPYAAGPSSPAYAQPMAASQPYVSQPVPRPYPDVSQPVSQPTPQSAPQSVPQWGAGPTTSGMPSGGYAIPAPRVQQPPARQSTRRKPAGPVAVLGVLGLILISFAVMMAVIWANGYGIGPIVRVVTIWLAAVCVFMGVMVIVLGFMGRRSGGMIPLGLMAGVCAVVMIFVSGTYSAYSYDLRHDDGAYAATIDLGQNRGSENEHGMNEVQADGYFAADSSEKTYKVLTQGVAFNGGNYENDKALIDLSQWESTHNPHELELMDGKKTISNCPSGTITVSAYQSQVQIVLPDGCSYGFGSNGYGYSYANAIGGKYQAVRSGYDVIAFIGNYASTFDANDMTGPNYDWIHDYNKSPLYGPELRISVPYALEARVSVAYASDWTGATFEQFSDDHGTESGRRERENSTRTKADTDDALHRANGNTGGGSDEGDADSSGSDGSTGSSSDSSTGGSAETQQETEQSKQQEESL
jgi:phage shock protein PspC (stress-responsive transcriptional regulator)